MKTGTKQLGIDGPRVSSLGLGCMGMGRLALYGDNDPEEGIRTIHAAVAGGANLLDTGDFYGMGQNELLVGRAISELGPGGREKVILSVKFGAQRAPDGTWIGLDCRPAAVKNALAQSLSKLGVDYIDVYRPARLDPAVPIEETVGAIAEMVKQGYVRHIGLSEMSAETARKAKAVAPICDMQIEYGLATRSIETKVLPGLRELGVGVTAYGVLSRGLLSGSVPQEKGDFRKHLPRFTGENWESNQTLANTLAALASERGVSAAQLAIAWVLAKGDDIVPVLGSRKVAQIEEALRALEIKLSGEEIALLERSVPAERVAGTRYAEYAMAHLDSER
ncbi:MAG TPA: aldo/keto reductase [Granulicella sp.]|jgi:aryl-alcohol dehydrogenase-like predicted oxidoreductase|nr:aldo/keto reductase [Granulicella sp.]